MKTTKKMRTEIQDWINGIPGKEYSPGMILRNVGYRWVTVINIWGTTTVYKISIEDFYNQQIR